MFPNLHIVVNVYFFNNYHTIVIGRIGISRINYKLVSLS